MELFLRTKQGAEYGRLKGKRTLHPLLSTISTEHSAPVIGPVRLRRGKAADVHGAESYVAEVIAVARQAGATGELIVRADSKFYTTADVVAACRRGGAYFSLSTGINADIAAVISRIPDQDWVDIEYPNPVEDPDTGQLISKAQVVQVAYTASRGRRKRDRVTATLIVRRVLWENAQTMQGQGELFKVYRYHPVFTDNPAPLIEAETCHRQHAIIEPQIADLKNRALAHLPSASFQANNAWLTLAAMAHNLTRAAGCAASPFHARAETATIRAHLVTVPARIARSARRLAMHLPLNWPWQTAWQRLFATADSPPTPATLTDPTLATSQTQHTEQAGASARRVSHALPEPTTEYIRSYRPT